jgi:citrate synthase
MGFTPDVFTVMFAIPRTVGWLAQWEELLQDPEQKISRPRQIYIGYESRDVVAIKERGTSKGKAKS